MSKAQTKQGAGRSGTAQARTNAKGRGSTGSAGSASANGSRGGARAAGAGGQRGGSGRATAGPQRGSAGGDKTVATTSRRSSPVAKATSSKPGSVGVQRKRGLLGMSSLEATTLILSIIGLGIAVYATILHYDTSIKPFCVAGAGLVNCESVMTSSESVVFGVFPVAVLGMVFYLFMIAINGPWAWRAKFPAVMGGRFINSRPDAIKWTRVGSIVVGMGFAIYLIYAELVQIGHICLWCTGEHIVTFLLFVIIVFHASFSSGRTETPLRT
jgi:uncharacterized membrane protein